jgi:DNA-binding SARP family transcriptional activator/tetratricopeptide (TPR) repeat protein
VSVELGVLGPLEVKVDGRVVPIPAGRARILLAALLLRANRVVPVDVLVDWLWDGTPPDPSRAKATLHMVVRRLRQALGSVQVVRTAAGGYVADVPPGGLDLHRYRELVEARRYAEALALWRGEPLSDVRSDSLHRDEVAPLLEEHLAVTEKRVEADLDAGRSLDVVPELRVLTARYPLHERFWGQLVRALHGAGQQADALAAYEAVRARLADELGIDPGRALRELHAAVLAGRVAPERSSGVVPRQLPPVPEFVGRAEVVAELTALLSADGARVPLALISGAPGIGKTALAVHVARLLLDDFPDGQLFADLRGYSPSSAVTATVVLPRFLRALGIAAEDVPGDPEEQVALYRSLLGDRRVLVLLDNVRQADDVRLLLPGHPRCAVLVTSREGMPGLVAGDGARSFVIEPLRPHESLALLGGVLGAEVLDAAPEAAADLAETCAHWPLALRIAGAHLAGRPALDLARYVGELRGEDRLDALAIEGDEQLAMRAAFDLSYVGLAADARAAFRLLGMVPGDDISTAAAAALLGCDVVGARRLLGTLVRANLVRQPAAGRFTSHDLLREYAAAKALAEDDEETRRAAMRRLLDFYIDTSLNATASLRSLRPDVSTGTSRERALEFADRRQALEWCEVEQANLAAATRCAAESGFVEHAWRLPVAQWAFFDLAKRFAESIPVLEIAIAAAHTIDDPTVRSITSQALAMTYGDAERYDDAIPLCHEVLDIRRATGDRRGEGLALNALAICHLRRQESEKGIGLLEESRRILVEVGERQGEAITLNTLSGALAACGRGDEAVAVSLEALRLVEGTDDPVVMGRFLDNYGNALAAAGRVDDAVRAYRSAQSKAVEARDHTTEAAALDNLARTLAAMGDVAGARECLTEALALWPVTSAAANRIRMRLTAL